VADWPTLAELKAELGVTDSLHDVSLSSALAAAVEGVRADTGIDVFAVPTDTLHRAALLLAVIVSKAPEAPFGIAAVFDVGAVQVARQHPTYTKMLKGNRVSFGIA
jgi:hypothetical protein